MMKELTYERARRRLTEEFIQCESTADLLPLKEIIGQERAMRALNFGLKIKERGFNIYVSGPAGTGRKTATVIFIKELAKTMPVPPDWCYVNNFQDPLTPNALKLPAGKGAKFQRDVEEFVTEMQKALTKAFESDEYAKQRDETLEAIETERNALTEQVNTIARKEGFILQRSPIGLLIIPAVEGKPVNEQEFARLPPKVQSEIQHKREALQDKLRTALRQFRDLEKKTDAAVEDLNKKVAIFAMEQLFHALLEEYSVVDEVKKYLEDVQNDILDNLPVILGKGQEQQPKLPFALPGVTEDPTQRYRVNLVVDNKKVIGAPVVMELNPTYQNLFGKTEKESVFGALTTDYTMIRCGSAHKANGGFLVIPVEDLLTNPFAWDSLKRAVMNGKLEIEEVTERMGFLATKSIRPEPIPFDAKVILIGNPQLYYALYELDRDFKELFKVKADFDSTMERNEENIRDYASFICRVCLDENLKHLDSSGIKTVIEYSSRLADDQKKLSTWFANVTDVIREASFYASEDGAEFTSKKHVDKALDEKVYRSNLIQKKMEEMIARGVLLIETDGEAVGQVNGLAVLGIGDYGFGRPNRVTASVGVGEDGVIDIEREANMGGPIHTKGVLILSGYLSERYAQDKPLSLNARLVFEQSYSGVEGDSASSTELYSILSALSGKPIRQYLAVTGSVNQKGEVQAIGGVNEKIEGYFEVCKAKGITGKQGVVIPASNVENLMLKEEVVDAIKSGKFHIYPVKTIDEGIEVLTGAKAGERRPDGTYEEGTINGLVQKRLLEMAERIKEFTS
jgi:lon-related putative ATP-dependent protease